jgi:hypothetical protein
MVTVDGTDFRIYEPTPFSPMWYSHKYKGPGLRYEVALSIRGGDIVCILMVTMLAVLGLISVYFGRY